MGQTHDANAGNGELAVSIIIPVYNKADSIGACVESLARQTAPSTSFEVILVDDGSTDDSLERCRRLSERYGFVRVIAQENQGVSGARNTGLRNASGTYIMFLDADDSISDNAIQGVLGVFESLGDAVDVVTYRMRYYYPATGRTSYHARRAWLSKTGLYPLDEYPFIAQSTMNICIRNRWEENILFDTSLKMGEDQLYIAQNLMRKAAIGYCAEAEYVYVRDRGNASSRGNNPFYAFDDMMSLYGSLVAIAHQIPEMSEYAYQLILYNFDWRIRATMLFPDYCTGVEHGRQEARLAAIVRAIPCEEIARSPYMNQYHKAFLLKRYGLVDELEAPYYTASGTYVMLWDGFAWKTLVPKIIFEQCLLEGELLRIRGRFVCPAFLLDYQPALEFQTPDGHLLVPVLGDSSYDYAAAHRRTTKAWSFSCEFDVSEVDSTSICVGGSMRGRPFPKVRIEFKPPRHNARIVGGTYFFGGLALRLQAGALHLRRSGDARDVQMLRRFDLNHSRHTARRAMTRLFALRNWKRRFWLYSDLPTSRSEGNALMQLLHDIDIDDGIDRYYVSEYGEEIVARYPQLKGHVVGFRSHDQVYLSLRAELVLSSYLEHFTYLPLKRKTFNQLGDLMAVQRRIYLQHGVLHAHIPWYFSYDRIAFDYEVVSTSFEVDNLTSNYSFPESALITSGAPRLDGLVPHAPGTLPRRRILMVPSWRAYLVTGTSANRKGLDAEFVKSSVYRGIEGFVRLVSESGLLEDYDCTLELKLHPNFNCYRHLFEWDDSRISLAGETIDEGDYGIVITDFSSYVYDFVYVGADIIYFLPDAEEFRAGMNHYSRLDWPLEEGFGPYCETPGEALAALRRILEGSVPPEKAALYRERIEGLFLHRDGHNRDRLYGELRRIADTLPESRKVLPRSAFVPSGLQAERGRRLVGPGAASGLGGEVTATSAGIAGAVEPGGDLGENARNPESHIPSGHGAG